MRSSRREQTSALALASALLSVCRVLDRAAKEGERRERRKRRSGGRRARIRLLPSLSHWHTYSAHANRRADSAAPASTAH